MKVETSAEPCFYFHLSNIIFDQIVIAQEHNFEKPDIQDLLFVAY